MKEIIKKLVELAKEYERFGNDLGFPTMDFTFLSVKAIPTVRLWLTAKREASVNFGSVEVRLYTNSIEFKYDATEDDLKKDYETGREILEKLKAEKMEELKVEADKKRNDRIKKLKEELENLENIKI